MEGIIQKFLPEAMLHSVTRLSGGLIHQTFKVLVKYDEKPAAFVLQQMNTTTFKSPVKVMKNISLTQNYLQKQAYPLAFPQILQTIDSEYLYKDEQGQYWRMFSFIADSVSYEVPPSIVHLYEAGKAYGVFLTAIKNLNPDLLEITIPNFHNLSDRFQHFKVSVENATPNRKQKAQEAINETRNYFNHFQFDFSHLPIRAVHNDAKLSNVLFNKNTQKCIAVIDLDTLMPGYVVTDFGDMVRVMCNTATEDEQDLGKVSFDLNSFEYLQKGFLAATTAWLTTAEKSNLVNGAIYIILEQAIRFLSDYLNHDQYYTVKYEEHNLDRAKNQLELLKSMMETDVASIID